MACGRSFTGERVGDVEYVPVTSLETATLTRSLEGCTSIISVLGLPYRSATWLALWPAMVRSVLDAASQLRVPLTVLDNAYVYGRAHGPMTEGTTLSPCSKKGRARLTGWSLIEDRVRAGQDIVVGRAADFIGKGVNTAVVPWTSIERLTQSNRRVRSLQWIGDPSTAHTYAYAKDVARALVLLDQDEASRQDSMVHLPVVRAVTGNEIGAALSDILACRIVVRPLPAALMKFASAFSAPAREQLEMMYQVDEDFIFDDATFRKHQPDFVQTTMQDVLDADL